VNQTIQFYRGQQGGSAPQRMFLAGGASIMAYTAQFFAEKLSLSVEYLNPFRNIEIDPSVNLEELAGVAHAFGEVVGLGLRNVAQCPVEMNLMPKSSLQRQQFQQKKPYFIATVFSLVLGVAAFGWFYAKLSSIKSASLADIQQRVSPLKQLETRLQSELNQVNQTTSKLNQLTDWNQRRFFWGDFLQELRGALMATEMSRQEALGVSHGVWIETFTTPTPTFVAAPTSEDELGEEGGGVSPDDPSSPGYYERLMIKRYGLDPRKAAAGTTTTTEAVIAAPGNTNEVAVVNIAFRAVNMRPISPMANDELAYELERALQSSPMFDPKETKLTGQIEVVDAAAVTFGFGVTLRLKHPLKL
jgi:hypothetical protein